MVFTKSRLVIYFTGREVLLRRVYSTALENTRGCFEQGIASRM